MTRSYSYLSIHRITSLALVVIAALSIFAYVSLTVATIFATAGRSQAATHAALLTSHIGELESSYLTLGNTITAGEAQARGFVVPKQVSIAQLPQENTLLSLRTQ